MRKAFILFLLILIAGAFVSCDLDALFGEDTIEEAPENTIPEEGDLTVYNNLQDDTKEAVDKIGEVYEVIAPEVARFFNGQELIDRFRDENGNPTPLIFNSWLVAYKSLTGWVPEVFEKAPKNAMFHNSHGYKDLSELPKDLRYVEFCEFRYLETNEYHSAGDICFIELRLVDGGVVKGSYYAKALSFDPTLRYEISTLGVDLLTGNHISYDYNTGEIGEPKYIMEYDDDGRLVKTTYFNESGEIRSCFTLEYDQTGRKTRKNSYDANGNLTGFSTYEYNNEGFVVKELIFNSSGIKISEQYYPGVFKNNKELYYHLFDENGDVTSKTVIERDNDGMIVSETVFSPGGEKQSKSYYSTTSNYSETELYDDARLVYRTEYNSEVFSVKNTEFWPSGCIKEIDEWDDNGNLLTHDLYGDGERYSYEIDLLNMPSEYVQQVDFSTDAEQTITLSLHGTSFIDASSLLVEIKVVDGSDNEILLDSSTYTLNFVGTNEQQVFSDETSIAYVVNSEKQLESIEIQLERNTPAEAYLKVKATGNAIQVGEADVIESWQYVNTVGVSDEGFIFDFDEGDFITVSNNDGFWYAVTKADYDTATLAGATTNIYGLIGDLGVDTEKTYYGIYRDRTNLKLLVTTGNNGTYASDVVVYFIFVKYTGEGEADFTTLTCQSEDLTELAKVPVLFHGAP